MLLCALAIPLLTVKVAFLYEDMKPSKFNTYCPGVYPTYRISAQVYPYFYGPHITWALSTVEDGKATPIIKPVGYTFKEHHDF